MMNMEYKVVDHVFFENGTEMSAPTDENMTRISGIIEKGIKYRGNGHISQHLVCQNKKVMTTLPHIKLPLHSSFFLIHVSF